MIKFNLLRVFQTPATPKQLFSVCVTAFLFCCSAGLLLCGVFSIIKYLPFTEIINLIIAGIMFCCFAGVLAYYFLKIIIHILEEQQTGIEN